MGVLQQVLCNHPLAKLHCGVVFGQGVSAKPADMRATYLPLQSLQEAMALSIFTHCCCSEMRILAPSSY